MTTIQDVADAAGVSKMTVSNVINNKPNVSNVTRQRVLDAIDDLDYRLNLAASALSSGHNGFVEVVVQDFNSPFYALLARMLSKQIDGIGMQAIVRQALYSADSERRILGQSNRMFCDALVLVTRGISLDEARLLSRGRVLILVDELSEQQEFCTVNTPSYEGARAAMAHLLDCGSRHAYILGSGRDRIGRQPGSRNPDRVGQLRLEGARDALRSRGMEFTDKMCVSTEWTFENARSAVHDLIADHPECDGIFAMSDATALGAIRGLADMGRRVPEDVRVIGFDGVSIGRFTTPSLSTIDVDMTAMADLIVLRVQTMLAGAGTPVPIAHDVAPFTLRVRESTAGTKTN